MGGTATWRGMAGRGQNIRVSAVLAMHEWEKSEALSESRHLAFASPLIFDGFDRGFSDAHKTKTVG